MFKVGIFLRYSWWKDDEIHYDETIARWCGIVMFVWLANTLKMEISCQLLAAAIES